MRRAWQRIGVDELRELWRLWKAGTTFDAIGTALGIPLDTVYGVVARRGGLAPREHRRAVTTLSVGEREEISRGLAREESIRAMAGRLHRAPSTISREITRHGGPERYRASVADQQAWAGACRPKPRRLITNRRLRTAVLEKLRADWSPQQISAWLVSEYPQDPTMRLSHEAIYQTLYVQARGALKKELISHLRRRQPIRRSRAARTTPHCGQILGAVSISERPPAAEDRAVPGHWEGDLLAGTQHSHLATLVERRSRFVMLVRLRGRDSESVVGALVRHVQRLPQGVMESLTWDRGLEMAQHAQFTIATDVQVYFCDPRSPWQRGSNENTNGLLRQYFPKGVDLSHFTQHQLNAVAAKLNSRPRQTLNWQTPAAVLAAAVASTD